MPTCEPSVRVRKGKKGIPPERVAAKERTGDNSLLKGKGQETECRKGPGSSTKEGGKARTEGLWVEGSWVTGP